MNIMNKKYLHWLEKNINESFNGKTIFISGGHSGIGYEVSRYALYYKMNVIWGSRDIVKANKIKENLLNEFPDGQILILKLDLADFTSIKHFVNEVSKNQIVFDYFYNNAGVYRMDKSLTKDGLDITIGTNFIGTYYLNKLMIEYFIESHQQVKFLFTTSILAYRYKINYNDFFLEEKYNKIKAYCYSKRLTIHMTKYLREKYPNFVFNLVHPGSTYTPLINKGYKNNFVKKAGKCFMKILFHSPSKAALSTLYSLSDKNINNMVCPRGLMNLSGYPKIKKVKKSLYENYLKSMDIANAIIDK